MLRRIFGYVEVHGLKGFLSALFCRFVNLKSSAFLSFSTEMKGKAGLEVGGPSKFFSSRGFFPAYSVVSSLDNCTYSDCTIWEGEVAEGNNFLYNEKHQPGRQYICEATSLADIADNSYDFLLSCHALEHLSNPLKGLDEWRRVVKPGGVLVIVTPHKDGTFDHARPITEFKHILYDYEQATPESDLSHLDEALRWHDLRLDKGVDFETFRERLKNNPTTRCLHHHVFDTQLVAKLLNHAGLKILELEPMRPCHIIAVARKPSENGKLDNSSFLSVENGAYIRSPFRSDRTVSKREL